MARSRTKKIDTLRWVGFSASSLALSAGSTAVTLISASTFPDTIMRTRGNLSAYLDSTSAPGGLIQVGVGFIVVPEGTGTTVTWSPLLDPNAPWFYYTRFSLGYEEMVTDVIDIPGMTSYRETIDSKAMRRSAPDTEVQVVFEQGTLLNADGCNIVVEGRVLLGQ